VHVTVTDGERDLLRRFLRFLNWPRIEDAAQVTDLFAAAPLVLAPKRGEWSGVSAAAYVSDKAEWRRRLAPLAAGFGNARTVRAEARALVPIITRDLGDKPLPLIVGLDQDGRRVDRHQLTGVLQACAFAARLLVDRDAGLRGRLGQCGAAVHKSHPPFVLTFEGKPRRHCTEEHAEAFRRQGGAERQKAYRERLKDTGR
jgi:hypothetical protein